MKATWTNILINILNKVNSFWFVVFQLLQTYYLWNKQDYLFIIGKSTDYDR